MHIQEAITEFRESALAKGSEGGSRDHEFFDRLGDFICSLPPSAEDVDKNIFG